VGEGEALERALDVDPHGDRGEDVGREDAEEQEPKRDEPLDVPLQASPSISALGCLVRHEGVDPAAIRSTMKLMRQFSLVAGKIAGARPVLSGRSVSPRRYVRAARRVIGQDGRSPGPDIRTGSGLSRACGSESAVAKPSVVTTPTSLPPCS
jgi:hypothetical protein